MLLADTPFPDIRLVGKVINGRKKVIVVVMANHKPTIIRHGNCVAKDRVPYERFDEELRDLLPREPIALAR